MACYFTMDPKHSVIKGMTCIFIVVALDEVNRLNACIFGHD